MTDRICGLPRWRLWSRTYLANTGDIRNMDLIPGWGRAPGGGHGNPLQYSCLENPMDKGAWWTTVHRSQRIRYDWSELACHMGTAFVINIWVIRALVEEISEKVPPLSATLPPRLYHIEGLFWFHLSCVSEDFFENQIFKSVI